VPAPAAEESDVFFARTVPLELTGARLLGLRLSLNTPVVSTQELPVGPARAALLVHDEADGRPNVTVGVRSLRTGAVALYSYEGDLREASSREAGIDEALSFAESMGFLFDEDEVAGGDASAKVRALGLWSDLMGQPGSVAAAPGPAPSEPPRRAAPAPRPGPRASAPPPPHDGPFGDPSELDSAGVPQFDGDPILSAAGQPEREAFGSGDASSARRPGEYVPQFEGDTGSDGALLAGEEPPEADVFGEDDPPLVDLADFEFEDDAAGTSDGPVLDLGAEGVEIGASGGGSARLPLSKFRDGGTPPPVPEVPTAPGRATLARLKLVRRGRDDGRPHPIARLFGAF
jgi:hypothetical protein